jgi:Arm domain-containing DNA-binding protein/integrase-like protein
LLAGQISVRAKITKRMVDAVRPGAHDLFVWDTEIKGFGLKVTPAGNRVYVLQYRAGGRLRRYTIGKHGSPWTPDKVRTEASRLLGDVADGEDPANAKRIDREALTVAELWEQFLTQHVEPKSKPRTAEEYGRLAKRSLLPAIGRLRVPDVSRDDITRFHHGLRETPYEANRALALASKLFNWAEQHGYRTDGTNPCRHVPKFREQKRERFLSVAELARLGEALDQAGRDVVASP